MEDESLEENEEVKIFEENVGNFTEKTGFRNLWKSEPSLVALEIDGAVLDDLERNTRGSARILSALSPLPLLLRRHHALYHMPSSDRRFLHNRQIFCVSGLQFGLS